MIIEQYTYETTRSIKSWIFLEILEKLVYYIIYIYIYIITCRNIKHEI